MEISEKDLFKIFFQLDLQAKSWKDKVKLEDVIRSLKNKLKINDIDSVEKCAIKKCLDCFILVRKNKYVDKRLKVDYEEMLKMNASSEVVFERSAGLVMEEEKKTTRQSCS